MLAFAPEATDANLVGVRSPYWPASAWLCVSSAIWAAPSPKALARRDPDANLLEVRLRMLACQSLLLMISAV